MSRNVQVEHRAKRHRYFHPSLISSRKLYNFLIRFGVDGGYHSIVCGEQSFLSFIFSTRNMRMNNGCSDNLLGIFISAFAEEE